MNKHHRIAFVVAVLSQASARLAACTVFCASDGDVTLAGNNEDYLNPHTRIWFVPADGGRYGVMYVGFSDGWPQGGMNDRGLFFDGLATPPRDVKRSNGKEAYRGNLARKVMRECATLDEVLALFARYDLGFMKKHQWIFCDAEGNSAIIEGDAVIPKKGRYQVATNFYQSRTKPEQSLCERYRIAASMLEGNRTVSVALFRRILAATHQEGRYPTVYSTIYDLKSGLVYVYHFHNFQNVVTLNLREELMKGEHTYDLPSLFPQTYAATVHKRQAGKTSREERRRLLRRKYKSAQPFTGCKVNE